MNVKFHIPDFVRHFKLDLILIEYLRKYPERFYDGVSIASVYGAFPNMLWNGGRFFHGPLDPKMITTAINQFNKRGIPLRFTMTNPLIKVEHLSDPICNLVMKEADNGLNGVIVYSPLLEDYIRDKYPHMTITSSTCKQIEDYDELCAEMEKDYSLVVLDYNFNNNLDVMEKLPHKEKAELLINPCCNAACKRRKDHYLNIGRSQIACTEHIKNRISQPFVPEPFECECMKRTIFDITDLPLHISPELIYEKYAPMGYENFKIEGRSVPDVNVLETYMYYMVKPEFRDKARLEILLLLTRDIKYLSACR
ncbi:MAG: hypothetical protein ACI4Q6_07750 [Huintestinicola sp.]